MIRVKEHEGKKHSTIVHRKVAHRKSDKLKMFQLYRNDCENQSHSLIFKISKTSQRQMPPNSPTIASNENKMFSGDQELIKSEVKDVESASSSFQLPPSTTVKKEEDCVLEPRRSLRLLAMQNKVHSSQGSVVRDNQTSCERISQRKLYPKMKIEYGNNSVKNSLIDKKKARKRKSSMNSSSTKCTRKALPEIAHDSDEHFLDPSSMRLKSMMLIPNPEISSTLLTPRTQDSIHPKFLNADPSQILANITRQETIAKSLATGKAVSLFFPDGFTSQAVKSGQNYFAPNESRMLQYNFKKAKFGLQHLSKKYPMLDPFTLDKCYGMSNCSLRKTEIMLLDAIAGKEAFPVNLSDFSCNSVNTSDCINLPYFHLNWYPIPYCKSSCEKLLNKEYCDIDPSCRDVIVQSMKILYSEEAILGAKF